jgi:hypothetical protein
MFQSFKTLSIVIKHLEKFLRKCLHRTPNVHEDHSRKEEGSSTYYIEVEGTLYLFVGEHKVPLNPNCRNIS